MACLTPFTVLLTCAACSFALCTDGHSACSSWVEKEGLDVRSQLNLLQVKASLGLRSTGKDQALDAPQDDLVAATSSRQSGNESGAVPQTTELIDELAPGFIRSNTSPEATETLQVTDPGTINLVVCGIISIVAVATFAGYLSGGRNWIWAMVVASYVVLLPGLFTKDFSFNIAAVVPTSIPILGGTRYQITSPHGHKGPIRESTRSLVPLLWQTGSHSGAVLIFAFAFLVPVAKIALLALGEAWRHSTDQSKVRTARRCIMMVQVVSKWASPDMYAFMLLYYLLRTVNSPPFLESIQVLDVGFACYNVFCVSSVASTMFVTLPSVNEEPVATASAPRRSLLRVEQSKLLMAATSAAIVWACLFAYGLLSPCMSLHLNTDVLVKALGLPSSLNSLVKSLGLEDLINSKVTLWKATETFWSWYRQTGELNLLLSTMMLGFFGIALTVIDVTFLLIAALMVSWPAAEGSVWRRFPAALLKWTHYIKHLAMLDVCTAGVIVVSFAAAIYREQGLIIRLEPGIFFVGAAEVVHSLLFFMVNQSVCLEK